MKALFALTLLLAAPTLAAKPARVLVKHHAPVIALSYAPDGTLASADERGRVTLTASSGQTKQSFSYKNPVNALAFSPDGKLLAIGVGRQIRLLDPKSEMKTAAPVRVFKTRQLAREVSFSADGKRMLTLESEYDDPNGYNGRFTVEVWDVNQGKPIRQRQITKSENFIAALAPDGQSFAVPAEGVTLELVSVSSGRARPLSDKFTYDTAPFEVPFVGTLAFSPDGKWLAGTGSYFEGAGHLSVWEVASRKLKWSRTFYDYGAAVAWSPDSSRVVAGTVYDTTYDDPKHLHRPTGAPIFSAQGQWQRSLQRVPNESSLLAWSPNGKTLATGNENGAIRLYDVN